MLTVEQIIACGLDKTEASEIAEAVNQILPTQSPTACWYEISRYILTPQHPFALHQLLYETVYADFDTATYGPPPAWLPTDEDITKANITRLMAELHIKTYPEFHAWSVANRDTFWQMMIDVLGIKATETYTEAQKDATGISTKLAQLNIVESCFNAPDDAIAIVTQRENDENLKTLTSHELESLTNRVANGLVDIGMNQGDAVAIDMPMNPESVAIYLGIVKAGCVVVGIADSFAPDEIATRLRIGKARAVFTQDYINRANKRLRLYEKVIAANAPKAIVFSCEGSGTVAQTEREEDITWQDFLSDTETFIAVLCSPDAPTNILFSSGTTGEPKAIPWTHTTPIKAATDAYLHHDIHPGDVLAWHTNLGWMMGPWLIYASLINKATIALYNGGSPTGRDFGVFVQNAKVSMLGVVPTLVRTWKNTDCMHGLDWHAIRAFSSTGECSNPEEMLYLMALAGYKPVIEYCGGTEIGGGYITGTRVQPAAPSTFTTPALGLNFRLFDDNGNLSNNGEVFIIPPSLGLSTSLLNADHNEVYFAGTPQSNLRRHGDAIQRLGNGFETEPWLAGAKYRVLGRVDDTMNLSGIKVSSAEIEEVLNIVSGIQETAAVAISPKDGGPSQLVIYTVLIASESELTRQDLHETLQTAISEHLNPLFRIHDVIVVDALPRTASNKIMRRLLRQQAM
ncbi:AMP-binding protein [Candidatus Poribacteria bacterium]|nr:AMP-binding protein [Candidatus Poribacteria bacterium]MYH79692.1 AMP-binding protein [Candidatus Poribacteria bacterium]MYK96622.1 AMP-binding protein [Candidatus Poribacteria bacterium]